MSEELEEKELLAVEQYSFSKLSSWHQCKLGFYQKYIERKKGIGNAFSSYGSFVHSLLEQYAKKEVNLWDLPDLYEWGFDFQVPEAFPPNAYKDLRQSYYDDGLLFLQNFPGYEKCKILGVEQDFNLKIDDWELIGFIDLVYINEDGELVLRDYKSKAAFKTIKEKKEYARQTYLYSLYVKEKYGRYPDRLEFLMFRKNKLERIEFNERDLDEALEWARGTVKEIREAFDYPPKDECCCDFFAENLCNHREYCAHSAFRIDGGEDDN